MSAMCDWQGAGARPCGHIAQIEVQDGAIGWRPFCLEHGNMAQSASLGAVRAIVPPRPETKNATDAGLKYDAGKPGVDLLPFESLIEIAKVLDFGAKKYAAHNWRKGMAWSRLGGAALRHLFAWMRGQDKDPETGLSHLAHLGCCVLFLLSFEATGAGTDDRYKPATPADKV